MIQDYLRAGAICSEIKKELNSFLKPGKYLLDIANYIEKRIYELGGKPAFPVNIGVNDITAHYTPTVNDRTRIKEGDLVKIDFGVHVNGCIADTAFTYCEKRSEMVEINKRALDIAISMVKPGTNVADIGKAIEEFVNSNGYGVIVNLTGHGLKPYDLHAEPTIPNIATNSNYMLRKGDVIAIEPFLCERMSRVKETGIKEIYSLIKKVNVRMPETRKLLQYIEMEYKTLPFARRWLCNCLLYTSPSPRD